ncbi:NAD(P)-binding protein [Violaceomyces palustris]|uniref:NAD(P)-binding protein n=1 Tax=Violaceomyces palustris TaxID=1673888 RepID=A0ACD0P119_9BASI|nr:NAD(P)-binding protein [Violaceomyces palustris]
MGARARRLAPDAFTRYCIVKPGNLAVVTGGASGIGLAAAKFYASQGLNVAVGDINDESLDKAKAEITEINPHVKALYARVDVSKLESVQNFHQRVEQEFEGTPISVLMANAGVGGPSKATSTDNWERILRVNFYGVLQVCQTFVPSMKKHQQPALVINTGSKQGITTPPGTGPAYNVSKAAVKVYTEQLAFELKQDKESKIDVKLLIPGWVHTGLTGAASGKPKPDGAWTPEQASTVAFMVERIKNGSFYILCPDNETPRELDLARMEWNMNDVIQDRPPLSRWDEGWSPAFNDFIKSRNL